jgi:hypothetical protein
MRIGRLYPAAVALVVGAMLGGVSVGWNTLGATEDNGNRIRELQPAHTGGGEAKQTPLLMRVLDPPQAVKGSDGKYHLVYELVLTNTSPGTATEGHIVLPSESTNLKDYPEYDAPILSVKGGKVVKAVDSYPDLKPGVRDPDYTLDDAPGNHVIVDIGGGRYAIYAHLVPGSVTVQEGDHVGRGQVLGRLAPLATPAPPICTST